MKLFRWGFNYKNILPIVKSFKSQQPSISLILFDSTFLLISSVEGRLLVAVLDEIVDVLEVNE